MILNISVNITTRFSVLYFIFFIFLLKPVNKPVHSDIITCFAFQFADINLLAEASINIRVAIPDNLTDSMAYCIILNIEYSILDVLLFTSTALLHFPGLHFA